MTEAIRYLLEMPTPPDMIDGYLDGYADDRDDYPDQSNRSERNWPLITRLIKITPAELYAASNLARATAEAAKVAA